MGKWQVYTLVDKGYVPLGSPLNLYYAVRKYFFYRAVTKDLRLRKIKKR